MDYFANPGKVGKELDGGAYSNCPLSKWPREKVSERTIIVQRGSIIPWTKINDYCES